MTQGSAMIRKSFSKPTWLAFAFAVLAHFPFFAYRIGTRHQEPACGAATLESKADANAKAKASRTRGVGRHTHNLELGDGSGFGYGQHGTSNSGLTSKRFSFGRRGQAARDR
jgi:hypothetical protein